MLKMLWRDERGATMLEYTILASLLAGGAIGVVLGVGDGLHAKWRAVLHAIHRL